MKAIRILIFLSFIAIAVLPGLAVPAPAMALTGNITLSPSSGTAGSTVSVAGTGFTPSSFYSVLFDTTVAGTGTADSSGRFMASVTVPSLPRGQYAVTATTYAPDTSNTENFTITPNLVLSTAAGRPGEIVTVSGSGFKASSGVTLYFDDTDVGTVTTTYTGAFSYASFTVPASSKGTHIVLAKDAVGASPTINFQVAEPELALSATSGRVGDEVTASGKGFKATTTVTLYFDTASVGSAVTDASGAFSGVRFAVPPGARGSYKVTAKDTTGGAPGITFSIQQSISINPMSAMPGEQVTITGAGFAKNSAVVLGFDTGTLAANITTNASGGFSGTFTVPPAFSGNHALEVRDAAGNSASASLATREKMTMTPATGSAGTLITLNGAGFSGNTLITVRYNGVPVTTAPPQVMTDATGSFTTSFEAPAAIAGSYNVEASDGLHTTSAKFTSVLEATISQVISDSTPAYVGMEMEMSGSGFKPNAKLSVTRNSEPKVLASANSSASGVFTIPLAIPPTKAGKHTLTVTDGVNTKQFTLIVESQPPAVPGLMQPAKGAKAGEPVLFDWKEVADVSGVTYTLQVASNDRFTPVIVEKDGLSQSEYRLSDNETLKPVTKQTPYYWRVKAVDGASNESAWSEPGSFSVGFVLTLPNGEPDIILSALIVYAAAASVVFVLSLSFVLGRKTARRY